MGDTPQQDPPGDGALPEDALPQSGTAAPPLIECPEVVWVVAWIALGMILLGLVSTFGVWSAASPEAASQPQFLTDINSAPAAELALLPGIGSELAERIVAEREAAGPFVSAEQLARVRGIGPKTIAQVAPLVICGNIPLDRLPSP